MSVVGQDEPKHVYSNVAKSGAWKTRKINLWSIARSFISQLKLGQDLTKISLPAELCHPYSMLEVMAFRELVLYKVLFGINEEQDPVERFLKVVRWCLAMIRQETFEKKPWNPIQGETHAAWVDHPDDHGKTHFISEQVSHHPPVSAFSVHNERHSIEMNANISFTVKFGGNSASVETAGGCTLSLQKLNEVYHLSRCTADMLIRNVVWGTKYIMWVGTFSIECPSSGLEASITFAEASNKENTVEGYLKRNGTADKLYTFQGVCGGQVYLYDGNKTPASKKLLIDVAAQQLSDISYLAAEQLQPLSSVMVWGKVNEHVLGGDMSSADKEKQAVEQAQRQRRADRAAKGEEWQPTHFQLVNNMWVSSKFAKPAAQANGAASSATPADGAAQVPAESSPVASPPAQAPVEQEEPAVSPASPATPSIPTEAVAEADVPPPNGTPAATTE